MQTYLDEYLSFRATPPSSSASRILISAAPRLGRSPLTIQVSHRDEDPSSSGTSLSFVLILARLSRSTTLEANSEMLADEIDIGALGPDRIHGLDGRYGNRDLDCDSDGRQVAGRSFGANASAAGGGAEEDDRQTAHKTIVDTILGIVLFA